MKKKIPFHNNNEPEYFSLGPEGRLQETFSQRSREIITLETCSFPFQPYLPVTTINIFISLYM